MLLQYLIKLFTDISMKNIFDGERKGKANLSNYTINRINRCDNVTTDTLIAITEQIIMRLILAQSFMRRL